MKVRFVVFLFVFGLVVSPVFSATTQPANSGSSTLGKPSVKFKEWQIGRSDKNTDTSSYNHNPTSFITSTETECHFTASVVYDGNQGDSVSPIDPKTIKWTLTGQDPSGLELQPPKTNWSGSHPSKLAGTSFNVVGTISVPEFNKNTSCSHIDDAQRLKRVPRHRGNTKLGFTLVFSAKTEDGQSIKPAELVLKADEIDQVRQEYVDYNKPIPTRHGYERTLWQSQDTYDFGHYKIMLNAGLAGKQSKWVAEINKLKSDKVGTFVVSDFVLTSGFRHPHHNYEHTPSTAKLSPHMYGYALDVRGTKDAADKDLDINGDDKNTAIDRDRMVTAAKATGSREPIVYPKKKHVHVDWAPENWEYRTKTSSTAKAKPYELPPAGTDTRAVKKEEEKAVKILPCGHKEGSAGSHVKTYHRACGHTDWYCLGAAGHNYVKCPRKSDGDFCRTDPKYKGYHLPCDTSHVHTYLSDQPPKPKQVTPTTTDPKPKQVTPTTTDPKPKQVLPKDSDDDDSDDDDGGTTRVDPQVTSPCGHTHKKSLASSHAAVNFNCGKHSYYACTPPSSSETNRHITQTLACGSHVGRACTASSSHLSAVSCPTQNGVSCSYGSYYACSPHTHAYPSTPKKPALQYHRCGHLLSASGDHSKVTSCSVTNANGDTCTNGRDYYACTPHVHSFPDVPEAPSKPDPPVETYVTCGAGHRHKTSESSSHASVSFSCGSHSYYACQSPSSSEVSRHEVGLLPCGEHTHRRCIAARSHTQARVCPGKNGKACTIGTYYVCKGPVHKHVYPETQDPKDVKKYACGHDTTHSRGSSYHAWVSSCRTKFESSPCTVSGGYYYCTQHAHKFVATCSSGHTYNPESDSAYNKHRVRTCRYSECRQTWQRCVSSTPLCSKPYRKRKGWKCWAE